MAQLSNHIKGRLLKYFEARLGAYKYRNGWYKTKQCPYCGREGKFGINLSLNRCNCFVCGEHPSTIDLVMDLENLETYTEVLRVLDKEEYSGYVYKEEAVELKSKKALYLPEGFKLLNQGDSLLAKSARAYVKKRGFDIEQVSKMGWGYGTKDKYLGYLIIPFHEHGELVYFNARLFIGNGPRYNNPEVSESGLGKSFIIYNKDALEIYKSVFLCEGAINAQTMGERGIAMGGKAVSRFQVNEILRSSVERIIILLDPDAMDRAIDLALQLVNFKKVKVVKLPDGKDCNDLGKDSVLRYVYQVHYQNYHELLMLKHSIYGERTLDTHNPVSLHEPSKRSQYQGFSIEG